MKDFWKMVDRWIEKSQLSTIVYVNKDGTEYRQTVKEFVQWFKSELVAGMLNPHAPIIKRFLLEELITEEELANV